MLKINKFDCIYFFMFFTISIIIMSINDLKILAIVSVVFFVFGLIIWFLKYKKLNIPVFYFLVFSYFSWFGQILIKCFEIKFNKTLLIEQCTGSLLVKSIKYSIVGYGAIFLGALIITKKEKLINQYSKLKNLHLKKSMIIIATVMIIIGMPQFIMNLINNVKISFNESYYSIYSVSKGSTISVSPIMNILNNVKMFFIPGIILLLSACKDNKIIRILSLSCITANFVLSFIAGSRGDAVCLLLVFYWFYFSQIKPIRIKNIVILCVIGFIVIKSFNVIAIFRVKNTKNLETFIGSIEESNKNNMFISTISEVGMNIYTLYHTMRLVPSEKNYSFGYTYFASFMAIIPSIVWGGYSFSDKAALAEWMMKELNLNYGPGYTILAESYYNFGMFGIFAMIIIGAIYAQFLQNNKKDNDKIILKNGFIAIFMYITLTSFRRTVLLIIRNSFYTILIPYILICIIKRRLEKRYD